MFIVLQQDYNKHMNWKKTLKPTWKKVAIALIPFIFPLVSIIIYHNLIFGVLPFAIANLLDIPIMFIIGANIIISAPFEPLLVPLGWWADNGGLTYGSPMIPGSFVVATTYALIIYMYLSLKPHTKFKKGK